MKSILIIVLVVLTLLSGVVYAQENMEKQKIDYLISAVENLNGAKFIRNGSSYDGREAADHLRMKLEKADGKVQTAEDFIRLCASRSYMTGKPYLIRLANGKTIKTEIYLRDKLKEYDLTEKHLR